MLDQLVNRVIYNISIKKVRQVLFQFQSQSHECSLLFEPLRHKSAPLSRANETFAADCRSRPNNIIIII